MRGGHGHCAMVQPAVSPAAPLVPMQHCHCVAWGTRDAARGFPGSAAVHAEHQPTLRLPQSPRICGRALCARRHPAQSRIRPPAGAGAAVLAVSRRQPPASPLPRSAPRSLAAAPQSHLQALRAQRLPEEYL